MLIQDVRISTKTAKTATVKWTVPNTPDASWIFIDGRFFAGPLQLGVLERSFDINFKTTQTRVVEIHNFTDLSIIPQIIEIEPNTKPIIQWNSSIDAVSYQVFHHFFGEPETKVYDKRIIDERTRYNIESPVLLKAGWNFFRVEATDEFGNISTRNQWNYFVYDIPKPINNLTVVDGSGGGLFDIEIF